MSIESKCEVTISDLIAYGLRDDLVATDIKGLEPGSIGRIIAAGPLTKQRSTKAFRVILVMLSGNPGKLVVWNQYFPNYSIERQDLSNPTLEAGEYFSPVYIVQAVSAFARRVAARAPSIGSILYEIPGVYIPGDIADF